MKGKFKDIAKDFGLLSEQQGPSKPTKNTTASDFEVNIPIQNEMEKVKISLGHSFNDVRPLDDVTISWEQESGDKVTSHSYTVDFEFSETVEKALAYDEFDIDLYVAYADNDKWRFIVEVEVTPREFSGDGGTISNDESAVRWDTLEIDIDDSKADEEGKPEGFDDIPDDLKEHLKKLAGIIK